MGTQWPKYIFFRKFRKFCSKIWLDQFKIVSWSKLIVKENHFFRKNLEPRFFMKLSSRQILCSARIWNRVRGVLIWMRRQTKCWNQMVLRREGLYFIIYTLLDFRVNELRHGWTSAQELRHTSLTSGHEFYMVPKLRFQPNLVPNLTFGAEVYSLVPKLLVPNIDSPLDFYKVRDLLCI